MRERLDRIFARDLVEGRGLEWRPAGNRRAIGEIDLGRTARVAIVELSEDIARGQRVASWTLEARDAGEWSTVASGETIGYKKLERIEASSLRALRLTVETLEEPLPVTVRLFAPE